jgi:hypothetical protein
MAKQKTVAPGRRGAVTRRSSNLLRAKNVQRRRRENLLLGGGVVLFVGLIALVIYLNIRSQQPVGNEQVLTSLGNTHIPDGDVAPIQYNSTPPTSGPHYGGMAPFGVNNTPVRYEQILHNLEDGGVAVYYQCEADCPELISQLEEIVTTYRRAERKVLLAPNEPTWTIDNSQPLHKDMENRIALTAWQRIDKFAEFDEARIRKFIERNEGIDHH